MARITPKASRHVSKKLGEIGTSIKKALTNVKGRVEKIATPKKEDLAEGQAKIQPATRGQAVTRNVEKEGIGKGRVGGAVVTSLAAGSIEIARQLLDSDTPFTAHSDAISDGRVNPADFPTYKKGTKSATSFRNAFKNAADKGDKTFKWEDRTYNTKKSADLARRVQTARKGKPPVPKKARGGLVKKSKFLFGLKK